MSTIDYPIGASVWQELRIRSLDGIPEFYSTVLGLTLEMNGNRGLLHADNSIAAGVSVNSDYVAGVSVNSDYPDEEIGWRVFLGTDDLDATVERAVAAGAQVIDLPHDIVIAGRAAELVDPFGARFGLAELPPGAAVPVSAQLGRMVLVDPTNHDIDAQITFQDALFPGNTIDYLDHGIHFFRNSAGLALRGAYEVSEEARAFLPPHWLPWFVVSDQTAALSGAKQAAGSVNTADNELSFGIWGVVVDPQGGEFKVLELNRPAL
ncbi:VOC family protein [Millisia brevis]|uniref:VOC family protein n=1 Tax=Millisia brevis TaxID=264148 RepID=UPI000829E87E|nr:VOC family protein [Millisia brevis]